LIFKLKSVKYDLNTVCPRKNANSRQKSKSLILFHLLLSWILQLTEKLKSSDWWYFEKRAHFEILEQIIDKNAVIVWDALPRFRIIIKFSNIRHLLILPKTNTKSLH
jgi:hypothetical protein